ncbi:hypothetical protein BVRB_8g197510 [Beta vulgaris subsp. vulgaris]|nr:hypothetical protein BVRB_8g197510 [Beta vulgaris subsp. vulgaris]
MAAIKKAEIQQVSSMAILPEHIIISHIFPKLHPKTLLRLQCTNKFYKTLISSQEFIDEHLHQSLSSSSHGLLIFFTAHVNGIQRLYSLDLDSPNSRAVYVPLPEPFHGEYNHFDIVGSSNGLLCLRSTIGNKHFSHYNGLGFLFLNPCTRMFGCSLYYPSLHVRSHEVGFGFGNDPKNNDYKLVVIEFCNIWGRKLYGRTLVYGMKKHSWDCVERMKFLDLSDGMPTCLPINGVVIDRKLLHWVFLSKSKKVLGIGCFDVELVRWADVSLPLPDYDEYDQDGRATKVVNLGVFDGCLCLSTTIEGSNVTDVWVMKEYGVKESWTKLLIATPSCQYTPLFDYGEGMRRKLLLSIDWPHKLGVETCVWYNLSDQTTKKLELGGAPLYFKVLSLCFGSLVNITGGRQIEAQREVRRGG